jgi:hypothetical protein
MADDTLSPIKTAVAPRPTFTVPNADVPVFPRLTVVAAVLLFPIFVVRDVTVVVPAALCPTVTFPLPVAPLNASCVSSFAYALSSVTLHTLPPLFPHIH